MKDIAMLVGVSRQAVSAALNDTKSCRISEDKCREIKRVARELNYVSNNAARSLKGAPSKTIGFMGPFMSSGLNSALISEISQMLTAEGYNILYNNYAHTSYSATESSLNLLARGVDGIIVYNSEKIKPFMEKQTVPYLFYSHNNYNYMDVGVDNEYGGYIATKHLLEHGHKKVAFITILPPGKKARYTGWRRAHHEAGINITDDDMIILRELDGDVDLVIDILKRRKISAVFASNDFIGAKLIKVLTQRGIGVPNDVAVVAYDGYAFSGFCAPSLTTVAQPIREQAEIGVKILLERIATKEISSPPANHLIKPILYAGASCGCQEKTINKLYRINTFDMLEKSAKMNFNTNIFNNQRSNENG